MSRDRKTELKSYINIRLGRFNEYEQMKRMFIKAFRAKSFREFWWYWNPTYGYYLGKYIFKPLQKFLPIGISTILTFAACGFFLHDLPIIILLLVLKGLLLPFPITISFIILGIINVTSTKMKITLKRIKPQNRIIVHLSTLIASLFIAIVIVRFLLNNFRSQLTLF